MPSDASPALGSVICGVRHDKGWSLADLSEIIGISQPYLSDIERGNRAIPYRRLCEFAAALDLPIRELTLYRITEDLAEIPELANYTLTLNIQELPDAD
jgi:transcriptional regulator with XRE-family HTH domain